MHKMSMTVLFLSFSSIFSMQKIQEMKLMVDGKKVESAESIHEDICVAILESGAKIIAQKTRSDATESISYICSIYNPHKKQYDWIKLKLQDRCFDNIQADAKLVPNLPQGDEVEISECSNFYNVLSHVDECKTHKVH